MNAKEALLKVVIDSILEKKGDKVLSMDLSNLDDAMTDFFITCEGSSPPQVKAIADNITFNVKKELGQYPTHVEGRTTSDWVLVDYFNLVVHIFHKDARARYRLEDLWGDASVTTLYAEDGSSKEIDDHRPILEPSMEGDESDW